MSKNTFLTAIVALSISIPTLSSASPNLQKEEGLAPKTSQQESKQQQDEEDTHLLLAKKWEKGAIYLDLKINGTFEGSLDGKTTLYGLWEVVENQEKTLTLNNDPIDEDEFNIRYKISSVSFNSMELIDAGGKALFLMDSES